MTRVSSSSLANCPWPVNDSHGFGLATMFALSRVVAFRLDHPQLGDLTLSHEKLAIGGATRLLLVIYHAEPGTSSAAKMAELASLAGAAADMSGDASPPPQLTLLQPRRRLPRRAG